MTDRDITEEILPGLKAQIDGHMTRVKILLLVRARQLKAQAMHEHFDEELIMQELLAYRNKLIDDNYQQYIKEKEKKR